MPNFITPRSQRRRGSQAGPLGGGPRSRDKISLYHCNYCQKDISDVIHIKCAICPNFDLCLECFSVGVEVTPHKRDHAYRVADNLSFPVYEPTWGADEEQLLLEAVDKFGPGNWGAIADDVGTKSLEECKRHYFAVYIDHDDFPNPKASKEMVEYEVTAARDAFGRQAVLKTPQKDTPAAAEGKAAEAEGIAGGSAQVKSEPEDKDTAMPDAPSEGPHEGDDPSATKLAPKILAGDPAALHEANAQKAKLHSKASTSGVDVKPAQGDTRTPTKPPLPPHSLNVNALTPHPRAPPHPITQSGSVADLGGKTDFTVGDNTVEVTGYHKKRDEFDPEYDNEAELMVSELEFPKNETEAERKLKLRLLDIYNMRLDERDRRKAYILERGLLNVKAQQAAEKKLGPVEVMLHSQLRVFARYHSASEHARMVEGLALEHSLRTRIAELKECRRAGVRKLGDADVFEQDKRRRLAAKEATMAPRAAAHTARRAEDTAGAGLASASKDSPRPNGLQQDARASMALLSWRTQRGVALDISFLPGVERLSQQERHLCATARLTPLHYLALKRDLIRRSQENGSVTRVEARNILKLDPVKVSRVYELLHSCNWIRSTPDIGSS
mmetsp:Transcript_30341/g.76460  ORF Transcript_30341/g.76460 Transcript_30341/m.76460 type:complete len:612 (-) Transcript_30341:102-1937(-)